MFKFPKSSLSSYPQLPVHWVMTESQLYQLIDEIDSVDSVSLDTEFIRRSTYWPVLALVQVNTGLGIYLVDVPKLDLTEFWQALSELPEMIWYACGEDLDIFYNASNCPPLTNVIDVQIATAYLTGNSYVGYSRAVWEVLGIALAKTESKSDWFARPLNAAQEKYAVDDVLYLPYLWQAIKAELKNRNILTHVLEDCMHYAKQLHANHNQQDEEVYLKFISPFYNHEQITVLQALCAWRESLARTINEPPSFVLRKQALREIIEFLPNNIKILSTTTINRVALRRYGGEILTIIKEAKSLPIEKRPPMPKPTYMSKKSHLKMSLRRYWHNTVR